MDEGVYILYNICIKKCPFIYTPLPNATWLQHMVPKWPPDDMAQDKSEDIGKWHR